MCLVLVEASILQYKTINLEVFFKEDTLFLNKCLDGERCYEILFFSIFILMFI